VSHLALFLVGGRASTTAALKLCCSILARVFGTRLLASVLNAGLGFENMASHNDAFALRRGCSRAQLSPTSSREVACVGGMQSGRAISAPPPRTSTSVPTLHLLKLAANGQCTGRLRGVRYP